MLSFREFVENNERLVSESNLTRISPEHNSLINPNPDLQTVLNHAARNSVLPAKKLSYLTKSVLNQSILTARKIKSLTPSQQTAIMIEQSAIIASLAHLFALYLESERVRGAK